METAGIGRGVWEERRRGGGGEGADHEEGEEGRAGEEPRGQPRVHGPVLQDAPLPGVQCKVPCSPQAPRAVSGQRGGDGAQG
eukprot:2205044-Rhodomonas_salina.1